MYPHTNRESSPLDQPCGLQCRLHPAVTQLNTVQLAQLLVKVLHVEVEVLLPVELQHLLHRFHRNPSGSDCACHSPTARYSRSGPAAPASAASCGPSRP